MTVSSGGGWISGSSWSSWYDRNKERRDRFLFQHPQWDIVLVRSRGVYEAVAGDYDSELEVLTDRSLSALMDRLESRYADEEDE